MAADRGVVQEAKKRRPIPLVFVGRAAEKVEAFPARFPEDRLATD
jgi:hypothetical protein